MDTPIESSRVSRRAVLLGALSLVWTPWGCRAQGAPTDRELGLPPQDSQDSVPIDAAYTDSVDALCDVLLPAEHDEAGTVVRPGAREARADRVLDADGFVTLAVALGLVPIVPEAARLAIGGSGDTLRSFLGAGLDALAALEVPLTSFRDLPRGAQERIVVRALDDERLRPAVLLVRTACMAAYCGGIESDVGLRELGFPPFEDHAEGLAVSGYPRLADGSRLVDAASEDLAALGDRLDDYSYRRRPAATPGDDPSLVLDANGDLL